jgi:hypothetical protein
MGWACLSAARHTHLCAPVPRDLGHRLHAVPSHPQCHVVESSIEGSPTLARLYSLEPLLFLFPFPFSINTKVPRASTLLFPLCSCHHCTAEVAIGKPRPSSVGRRHEHLPHSLSPFEQDPAARSYPTITSMGLFCRQRSPPVSSSVRHAICHFCGASAPPHSPVVFCIAWEPREAATSPEFRPPSPPFTAREARGHPTTFSLSEFATPKLPLTSHLDGEHHQSL